MKSEVRYRLDTEGGSGKLYTEKGLRILATRYGLPSDVRVVEVWRKAAEIEPCDIPEHLLQKKRDRLERKISALRKELEELEGQRDAEG